MDFHPPRFHIVIVLCNGAQWFEACLNALRGQTLPPWQITVFDNLLNRSLSEWIAGQEPFLRLMRSPRDLGFAAGVNRAVAAADDSADLIVLLNPDVVPALNILEQLAMVLTRHSRIGVLGCKVLDRDVETIRNVGLSLKGNGLPVEMGQGQPDRGQYRGLHEVAGVQTALMGLRAEVWRELGGMDEEFGSAFYAGLDFCARARLAGWKVAVSGEATVTHFNPWAPRRNDPQGLAAFFQGRARFLFKHQSPWDWVRHYLPAELRWLADVESKDMRLRALRAIGRAGLERLGRKGFHS